MAQEVETKVLDIDKEEVESRLKELGAKLVVSRRLFVDWLHDPNWFTRDGLGEGEDPWFLRVRSDSLGKCEITWKARSTVEGKVRKHKEINIAVPEHKDALDLFFEMGLVSYAHQEKDRDTYVLDKWQFDFDTYPGMPPFVEIESESKELVHEAIDKLGLSDNRTWTDGERTLIQQVYGLDWCNMKFHD
jgi:adenylate cyclase, class 2